MPDFILHRIKPWLNASSEMAWMSPHSMGNLSSWRSWNKCHHHSHLFLWNPLLPRPSSCSLRTLWQCIDLWRKRLFLGTIRALQLVSHGQFVFICPLGCCDKGLVFPDQIKVTETHYALQLRCRREEEALWVFCKASLPEPTRGTIHMSRFPGINTSF